MRRITMAFGLALATALALMPAAAAHDDIEAEAEGLEIEAYPAVVDLGELVTVEAEYEAEEPDDDATDDEDEANDADADATVDDSDDESAEDENDEADKAQAVAFTVDWGDGSGVQPMEHEQDSSRDNSINCPEGSTDSSDDQNTGDRAGSDSSTDETAPSSTPDEDPSRDSSSDPSGGGGSSDTSGDASDDRCGTDSSEDQTIEAEAFATHAYDADGDYVVTVTATPEGGEPVSASVTVHVGDGSARLDGDDRVETSVRIAREGWDDGDAAAVVLARADAFADALAAAGLSAAVDGPVLLTSSAEIPQAVIDEIDRLLGGAGTVYLLGGTAALSPDVEAALTELGHDVIRIAGADRVETALLIAEEILAAGGDLDEIVLASATNFPDALAGAAHAADDELPVLLTGPDRLDPRVAELLTELEDGVEDGVEVLVVGGPGALSEQVVADISALGLEVERLFGEDRFATAAAIAERLFDDATVVVLTTGANFPDALAGASHAGLNGAPILLVGDTLPEPVREYLDDRAGQIAILYVLGGDAAVSPAVLAEAEEILGL